MQDPILQLFANYSLLTYSFPSLGPSEKHARLAQVDLFALLPNLETWILCASTHEARSVNRVFYPADHDFIQRVLEAANPVFVHDPAPSSYEREPHPLDAAPRAFSQYGNPIRFVRLDRGGSACGFARILAGNDEDAAQLARELPNRFERVARRGMPPPSDAASLFQLVGRIYAERLRGIPEADWGREARATLVDLLRIPGRFCSSARSMYFARSLSERKVRFVASHEVGPTTSAGDSESEIDSRRNMFALVANTGQAISVLNFPEGLRNSPHATYHDWEGNDYFADLREMTSERLSYVGVPVRVDDNVIGVYQLIGVFEGTEALDRLYARLRLLLSEFGRSIEKIRQERAAETLLERSRGVSPPASSEAIRTFAESVLGESLRDLWPEDDFEVGVIFANEPGEPVAMGLCDASGLTPTEIRERSEDVLQTGSVTLLAGRGQPFCTDAKGLLLVPLSALGRDVGCVGIAASRDALGSRSVKNLAKQFVAVASPSWSGALAKEIGAQRARDDTEFRIQFDRMWATVHDLKAGLSKFFQKKDRLYQILENSMLTERERTKALSREIAETFAEMKPILAAARIASRRAFGRRIEKASLREIVDGAFVEALVHHSAACEFELEGDAQIETYAGDLQMVLYQVLLNSLQALERARVPTPAVVCRISESTWKRYDFELTIHDNAGGKGRARVVRDAILRDDKTLGKYVRQRCKRLLNIEVGVSGDDKTLALSFQVPARLTPR